MQLCVAAVTDCGSKLRASWLLSNSPTSDLGPQTHPVASAPGGNIADAHRVRRLVRLDTTEVSDYLTTFGP